MLCCPCAFKLLPEILAWGYHDFHLGSRWQETQTSMHCLLPDLTWLLCATKFPQITLSHLQSSAKNQCLKALLLKKPELFVGKEVEISSLSQGRFFSGFYSCCMTRSLSSTALTAPGGEAANPHSRAHVKNQPAPAMAATPSSPESRESTY